MDERGEPVNEQQALEYLNELCNTKHSEDSFDLLQFVSQLLGIQVTDESNATLLATYSAVNDPSQINSLLANKRQHFKTDRVEQSD
jgi:spermidine/putrescine-binding protein